MTRVDPAQRLRLAGIDDNLITRIAEAHEQGWDRRGPKALTSASAAAQHKLADLDRLAARRTTIDLGQPGLPDNGDQTTTERAGS